MSHGTNKTSGSNDEKDGSPSQTDVIFVVIDALVNVLEDEVLTFHCHENGDCPKPDGRHPAGSRVWSELLQSADGCESERSRVRSELHCCQDENENEVQVIGCCHDLHDDACHQHTSTHHRFS